jgi:hypothetical protein
LVVPEFLDALEKTAPSIWIRESDSVFAFYFILLFHTLGLSLLVGANTVVDLRLLGVMGDLPLKPLKKLFAIMWLGFGINAVSGVILILAYPTKALTNPIFYVKITIIALAIVTMNRIRTHVFGDEGMSESAMMARGVNLARVSLTLWICAITAGRLLAYTYTYLLYGRVAPGG